MKGAKKFLVEERIFVAISIVDGKCDRQDARGGQRPGIHNQRQDFFAWLSEQWEVIKGLSEDRIHAEICILKVIQQLDTLIVRV